MRIWKRLAVLAGTATLATALAVPTASASEPPPTVPQVARLACQGTMANGVPKAACEWRVRGTGASAVELWRGTGENGELTRVKVFESSDLTVHRFVDETVVAGNRYGYVLVVLGPEGNSRGTSNVARVSFVAPRPIERLRLACRRTTATNVHCEWPLPSSPDAAKVTLYATVDRAARQALTTLEPAAAGGFDMAVPAGAKVLRFALVAFDSANEVTGRSPVLAILVARPRR
ncbi:MAG: hypothetical protein Q7V88_17975 [Actinomycetota bacterium]|nr:hypothetical protein [Actinomycetota bacterium]